MSSRLDKNEMKESAIDIAVDAASSGLESNVTSISSSDTLVAEDNSRDNKLRTMSWQKTAAILCGEQVCLGIMSQTWCLSVLGWVPGIIVMIVVAILFYITSRTMHKFILHHPQIKNISDFAYYASGKKTYAREFAGVMLVANNVMLIGFHVSTGSMVLNTLSGHPTCTVVFSVTMMIIGIAMTLPRSLKLLSYGSLVSAAAMGISVLLWVAFAGIETAPKRGYPGNLLEDTRLSGGVHTYVWPRQGTSFVQMMNAVLNIVFLWVPQVLFPSFISEMKEPRDFPKALNALTVVSILLFIGLPIAGFVFLGKDATAPAFQSLGVETYKKVCVGFVIVPTLVIGVIYANVCARYLHARVMGEARQAHINAIKGKFYWGAIVVAIWIFAFILAEVIPSMGDFLALIGAAFGSFFGFIFFAVAYWQLYKGKLFSGLKRSIITVIHIFVMIFGLFVLFPGLYAAIRQVILDYSAKVALPFSCADSSI